MSIAAPRKPAKTPARPAKKPGAAAVSRVRVPRVSADVPITAGPAIKLTNKDAAKDPRFTRVIDKLEKSAAKTKKHPPAAQKAHEAQAAALPPANEKLAGAQSKQVDTMKQAEAGKPETASFQALMRAEIEKVMPKTLGDTEKFMKGEKKDQLKGAMTGNVDKQKAEATGGIKSAASQAPDPAAIPGKEVTPLPAEPAAAAAPAPGASEAMPAPKPQAEVSLQQSKVDADKQLTDANVTPEQLTKANDPRFSAVLTAKSAVAKQADSAPQKYCTDEQKTLSQAAGKAVADERKGLAAFVGVKGLSFAKVKSSQQLAKEKDEAERKKVADTIESIYKKTKESVEKKLSSLETDVSARFDQGMELALKTMTDYIDDRMFKWKLARYGSSLGLLWLKDKVMGLPDEVNVFYEMGRKLFTQALDRVIDEIAKLVDGRLKEAKDEITKGQKEISDYVNGLPANLQTVGKAAEKEMTGRFDELRQSVDDKKNDLAQNLAQRYKEAHDKANEKLKEMQDENKGLVTRLKETLGEVVKALREFKERIMGMLKKGKEAIDLIVADPIGFLKNLLSAIKKGLSQFVDSIWTHLKNGFMAWLFSTLEDAGVQLPKDWTLPSFLLLILQVLGITYEKMRAKAVKLIGPKAVMIIELVGKAIYTMVTVGPQKLWEEAKEFLGNIKETIIEGIKEWAVTAIIKAAVTKLATMFNPVGAIVQAILTIYNTVMFLIERINQILQFVEAVISSIFNIATGAIDSAANWIEKALARTIPLIIAFLARLLGLGGLSDKIKSLIKKLQTKVDQAIDKVIAKVVAGIKKLFGKGKDGKPDNRTDKQKEADLNQAIIASEKLLGDDGETPESIQSKLPKIQNQYRLMSLKLEGSKGKYHVSGEINPKKDTKDFVIEGDNFKVEPHEAKAPAEATKTNTAGASHHVPHKVMKLWFGDVLADVAKSVTDVALKKKLEKQGETCKKNPNGDGLSAIWLSVDAHKKAHSISRAVEDSEITLVKLSAAERRRKKAEIIEKEIKAQKKNNNIIIMRTQEGAPTSKPGLKVFESYQQKEQDWITTDKKIDEKFLTQVQRVFNRVYLGLLETAIALLKRAGLKPKKKPWETNLRGLAKHTWEKDPYYKIVPRK